LNRREEILDFGFVELQERMGDTALIADVARVSTGAVSDHSRNKGLINYLLRNNHESPFESVVFRFHIKAPIFIARQWFRHRIGSFSEVSGRYKEFEWITYKPDEWRGPGENNHQGSKSGVLSGDTQSNADICLKLSYDTAYQSYEQLLRLGVCKEQARLVMPMGIYTEFIWTVNLRSLFNFLELRQDDHAQKEIREYADAVYGLINTVELGDVVDAFDSYRHIKEVLRAIMNEVKDLDKVNDLMNELYSDLIVEGLDFV